MDDDKVRNMESEETSRSQAQHAEMNMDTRGTPDPTKVVEEHGVGGTQTSPNLPA